jgi:molybdenum-dependent DNA-binding transcriptional regulator ModE
MSAQEVRRLEVLTLVNNGSLALVKAAEVLDLGYRQAKRIWRNFREQGAGGLVHRGRGRKGNRRLAAGLRKRALALVRSKYSDYGPTLAAECLAEEDRLEVHPETLRRWGLAAGIWQLRGKAAYRMRRARRSCCGQMVQMDGSPHDWFEGRGPWCVLMVIIDDATNWTYARFYGGETLAAALDCFHRYIKVRGIPQELYVDRAGIYRADRRPTAREALAGTGPLTHFGQAMRQLTVKLILAGSPQAKGRVERRHAVFQDRLVKALRRRKINSIAGANAYLDKVFLDRLNERFTVQAAHPADVHRRPPRNLAEVFCLRACRQVSLDWCVLYEKRVFQLLRREQRLALARRTVEVHEQLDGRIVIRYQGRKLAFRERQPRPAVLATARSSAAAGPALPPAAPAAAWPSWRLAEKGHS